MCSESGNGDISSLQPFVQYLNKRVESLKFTLEYSTTNLYFLDVMVIKEKHGNISTDLFVNRQMPETISIIAHHTLNRENMAYHTVNS